MIHIVKGFGIVNKAQVDAFMELSCLFDDPADVGNLISGSSAFSKSHLNIWKFNSSRHCLSLTWRILSITLWDECNCAVFWAFFGITFLWDWNENWPFPFLWPLLSFPNLLAYWVQHFHSIIFQDYHIEILITILPCIIKFICNLRNMMSYTRHISLHSFLRWFKETCNSMKQILYIY